jgi:mannose-1-phosphate guanylyltransferase
MQAVFLAGGLGTRLRPLTTTRPKPLLPLLNRPMLLHLVDRLPDEIDEVVVTVGYMADEIRRFLATEDLGREVSVVEEPKPLGTGGALRNVVDRLDDPVVVFNADVISSLHLAEMLAFHRRKGGAGTLALWEVDDPRAFGVVALGEGSRIRTFVEKPKPEDAPSNLVNAGVYVLRRAGLEAIPSGREVSLERDVFPKLLGRGLYGYRFEGYWADAGTRENYLRAAKILLHHYGTSVNVAATIHPEADIVRPVLVGRDAVVHGALGPSACLGDGCVVRGRVANATLFDDVVVETGAVVEDSVVGEGCRIGPKATVKMSLLGDGVRVGRGQVVVDRRVGA